MLIQHYLTILYQQIKINNQLIEINPLKKTETSGEILYESMNNLLSKLNLSNNDIFLDIGSGNGKVILQVFLNSIVKKVVGIEILPHLYQTSLLAAKKIKEDLPTFFIPHRKIIFLNKDFLKFLPDASVVFLNSTCFSQLILFRLSQLIENKKKIHTVLSTRPLFLSRQFKFKKAIPVECSWDTALCYVYNRLLNS